MSQFNAANQIIVLTKKLNKKTHKPNSMNRNKIQHYTNTHTQTHTEITQYKSTTEHYECMLVN